MPNGNMLRMRSETDYAYSICALNTEERPARHASILQDLQTDQSFAGEFKVLKLMALACSPRTDVDRDTFNQRVHSPLLP